ncbi:Uncharacterised protein [Mycobacteroides abscessus subsp. massiliense]|nr:Uncharacterised protein [Mycobacteroides abscessus subsp. massiliense]SKE07146.1 Uncharacterised protein [Mycobacteroides abscessus subsp. massiliense]SKE08512.1 Uncharacterised protein [Mycobacteroides abscessus subsp. massiliense]SKE60304.1 Uncharacterised protein [Mycobacteroides abscessus subsp. massiliense]SKE62376.1 Uncharacterised protein [Mycobacteroides abscessus subsp. massiliense]
MLDDQPLGEHPGVVLHISPGTPETGLWCPRCLKPSGYALPLYVLGAEGPWRIATVRKCHDCDVPLTDG